MTFFQNGDGALPEAAHAEGAEPAEVASEAAELRQEAARIEALLEDVRELAARPVWQRVEELVQRLTGLYGGGLARMLAILDEAGVADAALAERMASDELLASLLLLHGLHPLPLEERVRRALEAARPEIESHVGPVELVAVEGDVVQLRVAAQSSVGVAPLLSVERLLERALRDAAPELGRVTVAGLPPPPGRSEGRGDGLVQIDLGRSRASGAKVAP
jgi:hypothetical protein